MKTPETNLEILKVLADELTIRDEKLKKAEARFTRFFMLQSVPMAIFNANEGGIFVDVNDAFVKLLGWSRNELIGSKYDRFIDEAYIDKTENFLRNIVEEGLEGINIINRYKTKSGDTKTLVWNGTSPDEDGYTQYICIDITHQIETLNRIENSNKILNLLATNGSDLVCLHGSSGQYKYVSPNSKKIIGYEPKELIGKHPYEFMNEHDVHRVENRIDINEILLRGETPTTLTRFLKKSGEWIWLESILSKVENSDDGSEYHSSSRDVTENISIRKTLAAREEMYKAIINNPLAFVKLLDIEGNSVYCTDTVENFTGYTAEEHLAHKSFELIHPEDLDLVVSTLERVVLSKEDTDIISRGKHKNGNWIKTKSKVIPIVDPFGEVNYVMTISEKIK